MCVALETVPSVCASTCSASASAVTEIITDVQTYDMCICIIIMHMDVIQTVKAFCHRAHYTGDPHWDEFDLYVCT